MREIDSKTAEIEGKTGQNPQKRPVLAERQSEMRVRMKRPKTGGRKKGSLNQKTRDTRAWAWAMLRGTAADRRLNRILDKASAHMQARILLAWMKLAYGEPTTYEGPSNAGDTSEILAAARARVAKFRQKPAPPTAGAPTFPEWMKENGLTHQASEEQPREAPRRTKRIVVQ